MIKDKLVFRREFSIDGFSQVFPSGTYNIESLNEIAEVSPNTVHGETPISLYIPMDPGDFGCDRTLSTNLQVLYEALIRDSEPVHFGEYGRIAHLTFAEIRASRDFEMDKRAIERAENEGMTPHPNG